MNGIRNFCLAGWFDSAITSDHSGVLTTSGVIVNGYQQLNPTAVTVNGSVSGNVAMYQHWTGTNLKRVTLIWNGYKSAAAQTLALPTAFSFISYWIVSDLQTNGKIEGLSSGTAQTFSVLTGLALGGGTTGAQTYLQSYSQGMCRAGFDTVRITCTVNASNGICIIEGQ